MDQANAYASLTCPLPNCGSDLHLTWELSAGLFSANLDEPLTPADAWTSSWRVVCEEGHCVLVPGPATCPCGRDECTPECNDADVDTSDELRTFRLTDLARLRDLLGAPTP